MRRMRFLLSALAVFLLGGTSLPAGTPMKYYRLSAQQKDISGPDSWTEFRLRDTRDTVGGDWLGTDADPVALPVSGEIPVRTGIPIGFDFPFGDSLMRVFGLSGDGMVFLSTGNGDFKPCYGFDISYNASVVNVIQALPVFLQWGTPYSATVVSDDRTRIAYCSQEDTLTIRFENVLVCDKASTDAYRWSYDLIINSSGDVVLNPVSFEASLTESQFAMVFGLKGTTENGCVFAKDWSASAVSESKAGLNVAEFPGKGNQLAFSFPEPCQKPENVGASLQMTKLLEQSAQINLVLEGDYDGVLAFVADNGQVADKPQDGKVYAFSSWNPSLTDSIGNYPIRLCGTSTALSLGDLTSATTYYVYVFPYNDLCLEGPKYQEEGIVLPFTTPEPAPLVAGVEADKDRVAVSFADWQAEDEILIGVSRRNYGATDRIIDMDGKDFEAGDTIFYRQAPQFPQTGDGEQYIETAYAGTLRDARFEMGGLKEGTPYYFFIFGKRREMLPTPPNIRGPEAIRSVPCPMNTISLRNVFAGAMKVSCRPDGRARKRKG